MLKQAVVAVVAAAALGGIVTPAALADDSQGNLKITDVTVNDGKAVTIDARGTVSFPVDLTYIDDRVYGQRYELFLYHGTLDGPTTAQPTTGGPCRVADAEVIQCRFNFRLSSAVLANHHAGSWHVSAFVRSGVDGDYHRKPDAVTFQLRREGRVTVNASPEPVRKGRKIAVTGKLTRANWDTNDYTGYAAQAKLQFRRAGTSTYTTVKPVTSSSSGVLKATVTASADGYWRYVFPGTSTTSPATATSDYIDVR
jgi:hypothetical protein